MRNIAFPNCPPMLPIPDGGSRHAELKCDIFLKQSKFNSASPQVIAEGGWIADKFFKRWNCQENYDFVRLQ
ncbi:hypothetical protein [Geopsychrobacter electrodiphilus]|uniref:hypothetical protein n=1 Tax=Geopsychrobacter electrodiphilus TaxID=225196 RepID=UPI0012EB9212|nr:hypothetical protein [Geopsychrobacter electrodiphilus]